MRRGNPPAEPGAEVATPEGYGTAERACYSLADDLRTARRSVPATMGLLRFAAGDYFVLGQVFCAYRVVAEADRVVFLEPAGDVGFDAAVVVGRNV